MAPLFTQHVVDAREDKMCTGRGLKQIGKWMQNQRARSAPFIILFLIWLPMETVQPNLEHTFMEKSCGLLSTTPTTKESLQLFCCHAIPWFSKSWYCLTWHRQANIYILLVQDSNLKYWIPCIEWAIIIIWDH